MKRLELHGFSHGYGQITYHIVLVPKYRHNIFYGLVKKDCERILKEACESRGYRIHALEVMDDHVHMFLEFHPSTSVSKVIMDLKGVSARELFKRHPELKRDCGRAICGPGASFIGA